MGFQVELLRSAVKVTILSAALVALSSAAQAQREPGPFAGLAGNWSGTGTINLSNGTKERIRCRAAYQTEGADSLRQNLRCASDSYTFDLNSQVRQEGNAFSGTWSETTRGASGMVEGKASPGQLQARVEGPGFSADLSVSTRSDKQTVSIRSEGTELSGVTITLARAR